MSQLPPAGWYSDPQGSPILRWWNGQAWTEHTSAGQPVVPAAPAYGTPTAVAYGSPALGAPSPSAGYGDIATAEMRRTTARSRLEVDGGWNRNRNAFTTFALVAIYVFIAVAGHVFVLGVLPVIMSVKSKNNKEPLAPVAMVVAAVAVVVAIIGLTGGF